MKQKMVIKVRMASDRSRSKAIKLVAAKFGVHSVSIAGADRDHVVVVGDGVDAIALIASLRKKIGSAELVQAGEGNKEEK